jgi:hypothetical protein
MSDRIRRLGGVALAVAVVGGLATVAPAAAAVNVTIHGPATAGYGATVHLTGSAPAGSTVAIYFKRKGAAGYVKRRSLKSDASGHYATTYIADSDYRYYAIASGVKGLSGLTQLPTATCTTSGALVGALPFPKSQMIDSEAFGAVEASNGAGQIAGIGYDGFSQYALIIRTPGHQFRVLDRLTYGNQFPGADVHVDVVTRSGGVLVDARPTNEPDADVDRRVAFVYTGGHRYQLAHASDWKTVVPLGVTSAGTIVGVVRAGAYGSAKARYAVVSWATARAPYKVLVHNGSLDPFAAVAANGTIAYVPQGGGSNYNVRFPSGRVAHLAKLDPLQIPYVNAASGNTFYGLAYAEKGSAMAKWSVASAPSSDAVPMTVLSPVAAQAWPITAGPRGDVVAYRGFPQSGTPRYLRTALGALVRIPSSYRAPNDISALAVDGDGSVAFTAASDHLPHILRCH